MRTYWIIALLLTALMPAPLAGLRGRVFSPPETALMTGGAVSFVAATGDRLDDMDFPPSSAPGPRPYPAWVGIFCGTDQRSRPCAD